MTGHRELTDRQVAARLRVAASRGISPRQYCLLNEWTYHTIHSRMVRSGLWNDIQMAKYAEVTR